MRDPPICMHMPVYSRLYGMILIYDRFCVWPGCSNNRAAYIYPLAEKKEDDLA